MFPVRASWIAPSSSFVASMNCAYGFFCFESVTDIVCFSVIGVSENVSLKNENAEF